MKKTNLINCRSHQSRIALTIDEIYLVSSQIQTAQLQYGEQALQELGEHGRMLSSILGGQAELRSLLDSVAVSNRGTPAAFPQISSTAKHQHNRPILGIRVSALQSQRFPCLPHCECKCHDVHSYQTPQRMHGLLGTIFAGYSGYPIENTKMCSLPECGSNSTFRAYCHYLFPPWFLTKALTLTVIATSRIKILISLTVRPTSEPGSEVFRFASSNDVKGLRNVLCKSRSPDMLECINGESLLSVGYVHHKQMLLSILFPNLLACSLLIT